MTVSLAAVLGYGLIAMSMIIGGWVAGGDRAVKHLCFILPMSILGATLVIADAIASAAH